LLGGRRGLLLAPLALGGFALPPVAPLTLGLLAFVLAPRRRRCDALAALAHFLSENLRDRRQGAQRATDTARLLAVRRHAATAGVDRARDPSSFGERAAERGDVLA
jgi:hypothetical protein